MWAALLKKEEGAVFKMGSIDWTDPEQVREYKRKWREEHKEGIRVRNAAWISLNKERVKEYKHWYYEKNTKSKDPCRSENERFRSDENPVKHLPREYKYGDKPSYEVRLYRIYHAMIQRCENDRDKSYKWYGGKGVRVCDEWRNSCKSFIDWAVGSGYSDELTIDRIDTSGNYSPDNCRWIPFSEQSANQISNINITYQGKTMNVSQWAKTMGVRKETLYSRIKSGWKTEDVVRKVKIGAN